MPSKQWTYPASFAGIDDCCTALDSFLTEHKLEKCIFKTELVAREALNNAVIHGCRHKNGSKIEVSIRLEPRFIHLTIKDSGPGFDYAHTHGSTENVDKPSGRGLAIFDQYTDEYRYSENGSKIEIKIQKGDE